MISDENILTFLYFLFFFFFLFVHLSTIFRLILKEIFAGEGNHCCVPHIQVKTNWEYLAFFFLNSVLNCLLMIYIWISKTSIHDTFLGAGGVGEQASPPSPAGGYIFQAHISNIKRFPNQFFLFNFLFSSCFLFLVSTLWGLSK